MPSKLALLALLLLTPTALQAQEAPKGEVTKHTFEQSKIFPGTVRDYWIYVPKQYDPAKPACVHVNQDGIQFNAPAVFDRLIHQKEMPVTIGVFVQPGRVKATSKDALDRFNRSVEYDGLGDDYARFLLEELLPEVEKKKTPDGRALKLSKDGNDRSIGGASSGAVCAFTAAWERPNEFRRVFSAIGTYVGLRGANEYPTLIRKYEPKPLRIFLQDGSKDLNIYGGDWWLANQEMERALKFAGYEVKHSWDDGGHSNVEGTKVFPEAMKWLWKDWPNPIKAGAGSQQLKEILLPGEGWKLVSEGYKSGNANAGNQPATPGPRGGRVDGLAANARGEVFFHDFHQIEISGRGRICRIGLDGKTTLFATDKMQSYVLGGPLILNWHQAFGPDGKLYVHESHEIVAYSQGKEDVVVKNEGDARFYATAHELVVRHDGGIYLTTGTWIWYVSPKREIKIVDTGLTDLWSIGFSPDQSLLYVAETYTQWVYSYQIQPDGSLGNKQKFYHLHHSDGAGGRLMNSRGMCVDRDGRLYVATLMGIQICDQAGRVNCIVPTPNGPATSMCFGGTNFDTLFAICGDKIYARKLKVRGANAFEAPIKPKAPNL